MTDPYPNEDAEDEEHQFLMPEDPRDLVYHKDAYSPDRCPWPHYFPSKSVLLKMMRACIGVTQVDKLWCYEAVPEDTKTADEAEEGTIDTLSSEVQQLNDALGAKLVNMLDAYQNKNTKNALITIRSDK